MIQKDAAPTFLALLCVLLLAASLRLQYHTDNPMWYTDEATHLNIVHHLLQGQVQYLAIEDSVLLFARLPLFHLLLAVSSVLFGEGMGTLRGLTGMLGVLSVALLFVMTVHLSKRRSLAVFAALSLAIFPDAVLYSRFGFSYNLLTLFMMLLVWGMVVYTRTLSRAWLALGALALGLGLVTDLMMGTLILPFLLVVGVTRWQDALRALPVILLPFAIYAAVMLLVAPSAFWFDLRYTLTRLNTLTIPEQVENVHRNYSILFNRSFWFALGFLGVFWITDRDYRWVVVLCLFFPLVALGRTVALFSLSFYYVIPLLPWVALGMGAALDGVWQTLGHKRILAVTGMALVVGIPLGDSVRHTLHQVQHRYVTDIDDFLINPDHAREVATFINAHTLEHDVVIASPGVGWLFHARTADFQMVIAYEGVEVVHLPGDIPISRFTFNPGYAQASFIVVDDLWRKWGIVHVPGLAALVQDVETHWSLVMQAGTIAVYTQQQ